MKLTFKEFASYKFLTEALRDKDLNKALRLILTSIERRLDSSKQPLVRLPGIDRFKNSKGNGFGIRYFCKDKTNFRLNFAKNVKSSEIESIDIFTPKGKTTPVAHIITKGISLARIIPFIAKQINKPKPGKYNVDLFEESVDISDEIKLTNITEAKSITIDGVEYSSKGEARRALGAKGFKGAKREAMLQQSVIVTNGSAETSNMNVDKSEAMLAKVEIDPNEMLDEHIPSFVSAVARGLSHTLVVSGRSGIGKTSSIFTEFDVKFRN